MKNPAARVPAHKRKGPSFRSSSGDPRVSASFWIHHKTKIVGEGFSLP